MNKFLPILVAATLLLPAGRNTRAAGSSVVVNPHVTTDRSVDCSRVETILRDLVSPGMSDEQKVLAVFNWTRRVLYHGDGPDELAYDFHRMVNILGNGSCLRQTAPMALLLERLGYRSRSWVHDTHHMIEVEYGGAWHCLDPHMNFYVYDRSSPPSIASVAQLQADTTMAFDAVAEGRACPGFLLCGDSPRWFCGSGEWTLDDGWPELTVTEPFGGITLRRGESYTRTWMPGEYFWRGAWQFDYGPYHTCGPADSKDAANWRLYEPHRAVVNNIPSYRHWAEGRLVYKPDLKTDHYLDAVLSRDNVTHDPSRGLVTTDKIRAGEAVFTVGCPYVLTAGKLELTLGGTGAVRAEVSADGGKRWIPVVPDEVFRDPAEGSFEGFLLKLVLGGDASVEGMELTSWFALNPLSLPYLTPGENTVRLEAESIGAPLTVRWRWAEGEDWSGLRSAEKTFDSPGEFTIRAAGNEQWPRNLELTLSVAP